MQNSFDMARVAGVSRQTVTRALNGLPDVSAATRERVIHAARQLNYRPNRAARGLVRGRVVTIGLVMEDLRNPYHPELASALSRIASEHGWSVILCDIGDDEDGARARLESIVHRVDALVLTGCRTDIVELLPDDALRGQALGIPIVILDGSPDDQVDAIVEIDYQAGVRAALDHLTTSGRRRIAMIDSSHIASSRRESYRDYLREHGLPWTTRSEFRADETHEGGVRAAHELLGLYPEADAVLVSTLTSELVVGQLLFRSGSRADIVCCPHALGTPITTENLLGRLRPTVGEGGASGSTRWPYPPHSKRRPTRQT